VNTLRVNPFHAGRPGGIKARLDLLQSGFDLLRQFDGYK
jgi:hypothetical protein